MNPVFAAGIFDSPWVAVVILIVTALANLLAKKRGEKQADEADAPPTAGEKPVTLSSLEESLRQLMGEESEAAKSAPPPIPRRERRIDTPGDTAPRLRPPPTRMSEPSVAGTMAGEEIERSSIRFEQLKEQGRHPAAAAGAGRRLRPARARHVRFWRDRQKARQAFVASLVFGPPRGLES